jgi:hypothetical protein
MQTRESPLTVHESLALRVGPAGWPNPVSGCLQLRRCRVSKFPARGVLQRVWSRTLLLVGEQSEVQDTSMCCSTIEHYYERGHYESH